jgi:F-type H+-transporting ATPase subunit alpha
LLERAAKLRDDLGGGSLTALPIIETQAGDITSYIPTNVVSITDGQIYLEGDLFYAGVRPAVNVGLSVSRVGGKAQIKAMRQVASQLRLDLAQYREMVGFTQFGAEMDKTVQAQLTRGAHMVQILKQGQYQPLSLPKQIMILYAGIKGFLDDVPVENLSLFETQFYPFITKNYANIEKDIKVNKELSDALRVQLDGAIAAFKSWFLSSIKK